MRVLYSGCRKQIWDIDAFLKDWHSEEFSPLGSLQSVKTLEALGLIRAAQKRQQRS